ncbi:MAG: Coq4 family protein [Pseudomonadota bacterium]
MAYSAPSFADHVPEHSIEYVDGIPVPPAPRIRPLHAFASVIKLLTNKEDTRQVFEVVTALAGASGRNMFKRFIATDYGRRVIEEPVKLEEILGDRERLRAMPDGSFGRAYLDFMEGEDLTPDGILDAAEEAGVDFRCETQFEEYRRLFIHLDVCHDLWHVITGYGRDALGELCNLGVTRVQSRNPGFRLIIWIGAFAIKLEQPKLPFWKAIDQGVELGEKIAWLPAQDIEALLPLPLEEVRRKLNVIEPTIYNAIPQDVKDSLLKPRVKKTQAQREGALAHG